MPCPPALRGLPPGSGKQWKRGGWRHGKSRDPLCDLGKSREIYRDNDAILGAKRSRWADPHSRVLVATPLRLQVVAVHPDVLPVVVAENRFCGRRNLEKLGFWAARLGHPLADQDLGFPCRLRFLLVRYGKEGQVCRPAHICLAGHLDSLGANAFERRRAKPGKHTPACLRPLRLPFDSPLTPSTTHFLPCHSTKPTHNRTTRKPGPGLAAAG